MLSIVDLWKMTLYTRYAHTGMASYQAVNGHLRHAYEADDAWQTFQSIRVLNTNDGLTWWGPNQTRTYRKRSSPFVPSNVHFEVLRRPKTLLASWFVANERP